VSENQDSPDGKRVYVIEILGPWHALAIAFAEAEPLSNAASVFYVGQTGLWPGARYRQHRLGKKSGAIFKKIRRERKKADLPPALVDGHDVRLRRDLMPPEEHLPQDAVLELEVATASQLRAMGHLVFQN
jgi:hypothetical protein